MQAGAYDTVLILFYFSLALSPSLPFSVCSFQRATPFFATTDVTYPLSRLLPTNQSGNNFALSLRTHTNRNCPWSETALCARTRIISILFKGCSILLKKGAWLSLFNVYDQALINLRQRKVQRSFRYLGPIQADESIEAIGMVIEKQVGDTCWKFVEP